jgi:hypothetical protein
MNRDAGNVLRRNVITSFLTLCIIWTRPLCIPAGRGAHSRGVADVGRGAVLQQASQACWREALGSPVLVQVRLKVPRARRRPALPIPPSTSSRAARRTTLDHHTAQGSQALGLRVLAL